MIRPLVSRAMLEFVDDELLRAPLLFDQVLSGTLDQVRRERAGMSPMQQAAAAELTRMLQGRQQQMAEYFTRSLREQARADLGQPLGDGPALGARGSRGVRPSSLPLALVDEAEVAIDVEIAHTIDLIKSTAEYELRELQTFTAALVGDMEMAQDHNPFHPEAYARALWAAAQALPLSRGVQASFMRHAGEPLAALLRQAYAASASRLEARGIVPASYRTLILPGGSRRDRSVESTFSPALRRVHDTLPALPIDLQGSADEARATAYQPIQPSGPQPSQHPFAPPPRWVPKPAAQSERSERQAQDLVMRLFDAIRNDTRVPADVLALIGGLKVPALKLAMREAQQMTEDDHPMWLFVNRLAYEAEMSPDPVDPERVRLLRLAAATIRQLASEDEQRSALYLWAGERLDIFLKQRLVRRCTAAASQIGALQKLEDKLLHSDHEPTTLHGTLDVSALDTIPADMLPGGPDAPPIPVRDESWLNEIKAGDWIRMFLQGRWVHVQLLWPGERGEIMLFGDGASDATWAIRRRALRSLHDARLLKSLTRRSLVRRAARQVHDQVMAAAA
jgi:hypothetical protein